MLITGLAGLVAGAFSMATGEYISVASQNELVHAEVDSERRELARVCAGLQPATGEHSQALARHRGSEGVRARPS